MVGYNGKLLRVDLSKRRVTFEDLSQGLTGGDDKLPERVYPVYLSASVLLPRIRK